MEPEQMRALLGQLKEEQATLADAIVALERYLVIREKTAMPPLPTPAQQKFAGLSTNGNGPAKGAVKGAISLRQAITDVLREAKRPMHVKEIWEQVYARGARTAAKRPDAVVALSAYTIDNVKKVAPRTFKWEGP